MCTKACKTWIVNNITPEDVNGKKILEVGSFDVNGNVREIVQALKPSEYVGIDAQMGPGVDTVCAAEDLVSRFGENSFDIIITANTFEHIGNWREALSNIKRVCKSSGLLIFIVPHKIPFHAYPNDFWRYSLEDIRNMFTDFETLTLEEDTNYPATVFAKLRKPENFTEVDLSNYKLYSIITNRLSLEIRQRDYFSPYFVFTAAKYGYYLLKIAIKRRLGIKIPEY